MADTPASSSAKDITIAIATILAVILILVGIRFSLEKRAQTVPYPYWLAVSDSKAAVIFGDTIYVFDGEGTIEQKILIPDHIVPCQLSWLNDKLFVSDWENNSLHLFGSSGIVSIPLSGGPAIGAHLNAVVDEYNNAIYVTDSDGHRVHAYDREGRYKRSFGSFGLGRGSLSSPKDIRFLNDTLYIGNVMRSGVDAFSVDGHYIKSIVEPKGNRLYNLITDFDLAEHHIVTIECDMLFAHCLVASYDRDGALLSTRPQETGQTSVGDIAVRANVVYVSDAANRTVTKYEASSLDSLGPASWDLNAIGEAYNDEYRMLKKLSSYSLIALFLCCIPLAYYYVQYRKTRQ